MHMRIDAVQAQAVDNPHKDTPEEDDKIRATCNPGHTPGHTLENT